MPRDLTESWGIFLSDSYSFIAFLSGEGREGICQKHYK